MLINKNSKDLNLLIAVLIMALSFSACYENQEGCLDPNSANYDVTADVACDDCCTFPTLSLAVSYAFGEDGYNRVDTVTNDLSQDFVIEDIKTYFSEITLSDDTQTYTIEEMLDYADASGADQQIVDDIVLATPTGFRYTLGTFTESNTYSSVSLRLGVPTEIDEAQSFLVEDSHPLAIAGDSLYIVDQNRFVKSWIRLRQIGIHELSDTIQVAGAMSYIKEFTDLTIEQQRGSSLDLNIKIDYQTLISGIDYNTMSKSEIAERLNDNLFLAVQSNF